MPGADPVAVIGVGAAGTLPAAARSSTRQPAPHPYRRQQGGPGLVATAVALPPPAGVHQRGRVGTFGPMKTALRNVRVFDGKQLLPPATVALDGDRIGADASGAKMADLLACRIGQDVRVAPAVGCDRQMQAWPDVVCCPAGTSTVQDIDCRDDWIPGWRSGGIAWQGAALDELIQDQTLVIMTCGPDEQHVSSLTVGLLLAAQCPATRDETGS
jgi:hypothetical protein